MLPNEECYPPFESVLLAIIRFVRVDDVLLVDTVVGEVDVAIRKGLVRRRITESKE